MASSIEIHLSDLPPELLPEYAINQTTSNNIDEISNWETSLRLTVQQKMQQGQEDIAKQIITEIEKILISSALEHTRGKRHEAANLLGYGRNTLTRKIKELAIEQ